MSCPSSIRHSRPFEHELSPITSRPGLLLVDLDGAISLNFLHFLKGLEPELIITSSYYLLLLFRLKKKDNDLMNANDRVHSLEDELRSIGSKMSKLENDHHKVIQELNVRLYLGFLKMVVVQQSI